MREGLVSVICPCFNAELHLFRLLDSLLRQTYKHLEIILVNAESSDNTADVIEKYIPLLKAEGYLVTVVNKKDGGVASDIDCGLKLFTGEFLTWPDSDDWLKPAAIEERVNILKENPDVGLVRCNAEMIEGLTGKSLGFFGAVSEKVYVHEKLFTDLLRLQTYFAPVCYMVRSSYFLNVNPSRSIYVNRKGGQNLQMMLPITHVYKSIQMEKALAFYFVRRNSGSRWMKRPEDFFYQESTMWGVTKETLLRMSNVDEAFLKDISYYFVRNKLLPAAFRAQLKSESMRLLNESGLGISKKVIGKVLIDLRCSKFTGFLDVISIRYWSRVLNRLFLDVVRS